MVGTYNDLFAVLLFCCTLNKVVQFSFIVFIICRFKNNTKRTEYIIGTERAPDIINFKMKLI